MKEKMIPSEDIAGDSGVLIPLKALPQFNEEMPCLVAIDTYCNTNFSIIVCLEGSSCHTWP